MESLHDDYLRRMNERKAAPRHKPVNLTSGQQIHYLRVRIGIKVNQHHSEITYGSNNHSRTNSFGSTSSAFGNLR